MPLPRIIRRLLWVWGFFLALLIALVFAGIFLPSVGHTPGPDVPDASAPVPSVVLVHADGMMQSMPIEVAATPEQWAVGLMNRSEVTRPMLFVFQEEAPRSFWMKNTLVPLDIAFFDKNGAWVSSASMEPCTKDPCTSYFSDGPAMYALELPVGGVGPSIGAGWSMALGPTFFDDTESH